MTQSKTKRSAIKPSEPKPIKYTPVDSESEQQATTTVPWNPWLGLVFIAIVFLGSQLLGSVVVSIYPFFKHWSSARSADWLSNSINAQFIYVLIAEVVSVALIVYFMRHRKASLKLIGLRKPRWSDLFVGLAAVVPYYVLYLLTVGVVSRLIPSLNVNQTQDIGFTNVHGAYQLTLTFISLVVLPPIAEEIMMRGFLFSSLKKAMPVVYAGVLTSLIFASLHLPEGGAAGPLYIAALDTFVLSLVLVYIRQKTGGLYSGMLLHAIKNGVAFVALFIVHVH